MGRLNAPVNWTQAKENFIDSYPLDDVSGINPETDLAHAVQKDAIQNSLDALDEGDSRSFGVEFKVDDLTDPTYVSIKDRGTTGLTGRPALTRSELERLSVEKYKKEKWSRMQAFGYSHPEGSPTKGARGQGKFIFIGSSRTGEMIFDTLRADGIYRIGHWETDENKPLMEPLEGKEAEEYARQHGLEPLEEIGTRIVIPNPKPELYRSFWYHVSEDGCDLERYISSVWWEAMINGRSFTVTVADEATKNVEPPKLYQRFQEDPDYFEHLKEHRVGKPFQDDFPGVLAKELVIAYSENEIPEELRGIALQRGEMTIERFDPLRGNPHLPPKLRKHIFGWLIMNQEGDKELKKTERASHYHFGQKRGSLAINLFGRNGWLSRKVEEFGEQLGYAAGGRDVSGSYSKSLNFLNQIAKDIGYNMEASVGGSREKEKEDYKKSKTRKEINPQLRVDYPTQGSRRVEFGEKVENIKARVVNYADVPQEYRLKVTLKKKEGYRKEDEKERLFIANDSGEVKAGEKTDWVGMPAINFEGYEEGTYVISAVSQRPDGTNRKEKRKLIYLNTDPPLQAGIFKELFIDTFDPPMTKWQYRTKVDSEKKITLILNDAHPLFEINSSKGEPKREYIDMCGLNALLDYDLRSKGLLVNSRDLDEIKKLRKKHPEEFEASAISISQARQELLFDGFRKR